MKALLYVDPNRAISAIDDRLFGSFIEHMGRAVYTGIYEPEHKSADENGFRQDVIDFVKPLNLGCVRYPGGNFVSGYRWEDGVGPKEQRPVRRDLAWFALEPNAFGTNEFMDWCYQAGVSPMMAVNLGTRGPQEAADLLEYCNVEKGTYLSDLRRAHGYEKPHNIKLWCLGNEMDGPWQICAKTAEEYGRVAHETAKMMKWIDPAIELVACGSSYKDMPTFGAWERTVLNHCYEEVEYLSLHQYYQNMDGDISRFLARSDDMDSFIKEVAQICEEVKQQKNGKKDIYLSFDEWNVWYHWQKEQNTAEKWIAARPIEEESYDFADALLVGGMINTLINNADTVKIACLAQLINVLAPIMTKPEGLAWVQTTYYPFLYASRFGRGQAVNYEMSVPKYICKDGTQAFYLSISCVLTNDKKNVIIFIVNRNLESEINLTLSGIQGKMTKWITMHGYDLAAGNNVDDQQVVPFEKPLSLLDEINLPKASWNMIEISLP